MYQPSLQAHYNYYTSVKFANVEELRMRYIKGNKHVPLQIL